jgi:beta-lactam-binding protein with PASTA domain
VEFRKRIESLTRIGLLLFIFTAVAFLSAVTTIRIAIRSREVSMPNLVGKSVSDAQVILDHDRLGMRVADRVYDKLPAGNIVRQSPPPNIAVKEGQFSHVVVSLGPMQVTVPAVEGESLRSARIRLLQTGLQLGEVTAPFLDRQEDTRAPDTVLVQEPRAGAQATSPRVDVLAPQGPRAAAFVMPFFIGLNEADAQRALTSAGVRGIKITRVPAMQWPAGTVIDQSPAAGARLSVDGPAEIKVAQPAAQPSGGGAASNENH